MALFSNINNSKKIKLDAKMIDFQQISNLCGNGLHDQQNQWITISSLLALWHWLHEYMISTKACKDDKFMHYSSTFTELEWQIQINNK